MTATARRIRPTPPTGSEKPRLAPPVPARTQVADFEAAAKDIGLTLLPWQRYAGRYLYALGKGDQWLYPEVAIVVARQNGKTALLGPHIMRRLAMGRRILHAAQTRELPRLLFNEIARWVETRYPKAIVRRGAGQETIEIPETGGFYKIIAATSGGPRGTSIDDVLVDELRELEEDFVSAVLPTMTARPNPQVLYLSNAGEEDSKALNAVRQRGEDDPSLAYLEWSAAPERAADDPVGWAQANPALGHFPTQYAFLERSYTSHHLAGTIAHFETEHLCRWVTTLRERLVDEHDWAACRVEALPKVMRPALAVSLDPEGVRASIAMAWRDGERICVKLLLNETGNKLDPDVLAEQVRSLSMRHAAQVGYDPISDAALVARLTGKVKRAESVAGQKYAAASSAFANLVAAGRVAWVDAAPVTDDLVWTVRKPDGDQGAYHAVRAQEDRPITAALAAIRAVWLASLKATSAPPRIR